MPATPWQNAQDIDSVSSAFQLLKKINSYNGTSRNIYAVAYAFRVELPGVIFVELNRFPFVACSGVPGITRGMHSSWCLQGNKMGSFFGIRFNISSCTGGGADTTFLDSLATNRRIWCLQMLRWEVAYDQRNIRFPWIQRDRTWLAPITIWWNFARFLSDNTLNRSFGCWRHVAWSMVDSYVNWTSNSFHRTQHVFYSVFTSSDKWSLCVFRLSVVLLKMMHFWASPANASTSLVVRVRLVNKKGA